MANCTQILLNRLKKYLAEEVGKCEKNFEEIKEIGETIWEYSNGVNKKTLMKIEEVSKRLVSSENSNVLLENGISEQKSILQMLESEQIEIRKSYEEMTVQYSYIKNNLKKNTDILNDENFKLVQRTLALNELEAEIKKYHISILDFQKKNSEIIEEIPKITEKDLVLQSEIQNLSTEIFEIQAKNLKSQKKILKTSKEVATYEDSLPALTVNYNNLLEEVSELSKKIGKLHSELFETIAKSTSSTLCTVCNGPEAGRMKKCIICGVSVHARCTKETKFTCEVCKAL